MRLLIGLLLGITLVTPATAQKKKPSAFDVEAKEYLGTPQSEASSKRGLEYLAKRQQADGHWKTKSYDADPAVSGLCTLAFLAAGHQPGRGKYGAVLTRAVDYLVEHVQKNGLVHNDGSAGPPMYGHGFATLALAELYGMTGRADLRPKLENAISLIVATQNKEGGWRYQPQVQDADISVSTAQIVALRAAHNAGIKVPPDTVKNAVIYLQKCWNKNDGGFAYQANSGGSGPARTSAAVLCLYLCGEQDTKECKGGIEYLRKHPFKTDEWAWREHLFYSYYYGTQAMYQVGGDDWKNWFTMVRERLIKSQQADGRWEDGPGDEYATAMAVLALQVPAGLLPIYQK